MLTNPLTVQPGRVGRVSYDTGRQRQRVGHPLDLADPEAAWSIAMSYQRKKFPSRPLRLDVLASPNATWKTPPLASYELRDYLNSGLAGTSAELPTTTPAQLPTMQPTYPPNPSYPPVVVHQQQVPSMTEPPTTMDAYGQFLFRQQGHLLQEAWMKVLTLEQQVQSVQQQLGTQKEQLDAANMDLRLKDREHELKLKDALRDQRDELEGEAPSGGLSGFMEAVSTPGSPLAGILGVLAGKLLGESPPPAVQAAGAPAQSGEMGQVMAGLAELLPDAETGTKVYMALSRILPHPGGLDQLLQLAGVS